MAWDPADKAKALKLYAAGASAPDIAARFPGKTRNAIIGLANRAGLCRPRGSAQPRQTTSRRHPAPKTRTKTRPKARIGASTHSRSDAGARSTNPVVRALRQDTARINQLSLAEGTRVDILSVGPGQCRFIVAGSGVAAVFCGREQDKTADTLTRKSYCAEHGTVVTIGPVRRRPNKRPTRGEERTK